MNPINISVMERLASCPEGVDEAFSFQCFVALVLRDEETGGHVALQPYHVDLAKALVEHPNLVVTAHVESGKTQIGQMFILWSVGRNPRLRCAVVSESSALAKAIVASCARYIADTSFDGCLALRRIFPNMAPSRVDSWSPAEGVITIDRPGGLKDPTIKAFGADQGAQGIRTDIMLFDDYVTPRTTETPYLRDQQFKAFNQRFYGRVVKTGRRIFFNNPQWDDDCAAQFARKKGVHEFMMPVTTTGQRGGPSQWEERWPAERIEEMCEQNPDFMAQLFCVRRKTGKTGKFPEAALRQAIDKGRGLSWPYIPEDPPEGAVVCIGVDFAFTKGKKSDRSAFVAVLREKPREHRKIGRRTVMDVRAGKWDEGEALANFEAFVRQFTRIGYRVRIRAESNQAQAWIVQRWSKITGAQIEPYTTTGAKKWNPVFGIPGLAASFVLGQYVVPSDSFGVVSGTAEELIGDLRSFSPDPKSHTGDLLMGLFFAEGLAQDVANYEMRAYTLADEPVPDSVVDEQAEVLAMVAKQVDSESDKTAAAMLAQVERERREAEEAERKRQEEMARVLNEGFDHGGGAWDLAGVMRRR